MNTSLTFRNYTKVQLSVLFYDDTSKMTLVAVTPKASCHNRIDKSPACLIDACVQRGALLIHVRVDNILPRAGESSYTPLAVGSQSLVSTSPDMLRWSCVVCVQPFDHFNIDIASTDKLVPIACGLHAC